MCSSDLPVTPAATAAPPTAVAAARGDGRVTLSWKASATDGGSAIVEYVVESSRDGGKTWQAAARVAATSVSVEGLVNGTSYVFRIATVNGVGTSAWSARSAAVVPATVPSAPLGLAIAGGGPVVTLTWTAPSATGGRPIVNYRVQWSVDGGASWKTLVRAPSTALRATLRGLPTGTPLAFRVAAQNAVGLGSSAEATIAPN